MTTCVFEGCGRQRAIKVSGLCSAHAMQMRRTGSLRPIQEYRTGCSFDGCTGKHAAKGYCSAHWKQQREGRPLSRLRQPRRKLAPGEWGLWYTNPEGYVLRRRGQSRPNSETQYQHRFVMEQQLGRSLLPEETVHHVNGVRGDNRPENLELWSSSHPSGQRVSDKVEWALEILALYAPDRIAQ